MLREAGAKKGNEYTLPHLVEMIPGIRPGELVQALEELQEEGRVKKLFRIMSPTEDGGIQDFEEFTDIPMEIEDWHAGRVIEVSPEDVKVFYQILDI